MIDRSIEQNIPEPGGTEKNADSIDNNTDALAKLFSLIHSYMTPEEVEQVSRASHLALETSQHVPRTPLRPIPPLEHALAVTMILAQVMHADAVGISAALVFEAVDADLLMLEQVAYTLGAPTAHVVECMSNLNILERKKQNAATGAMLSVQNTPSSASKKELDDTVLNVPLENKKPRIREAMRRQQAETVRKMVVAMADDPRVVLLKLAYRLHAMRRLCDAHISSDQQERLTMAEESREIYAPLAGRLGIARVESELQDLAFQILEPERYQWIVNVLEVEKKQWRSYVDRVCDVLRAEMGKIGVKAEISGRVKHAYSFYKKIARSVDDADDFEKLKAEADISQVHDLLAFRVLVDTTADCYVVLGHVHSMWRPKDGRIKDFIANPKPNGYSALHTTVFCLDDQLVEVQIRTHAMHETAEYGVAMHWHYKDAGDTASSSAKELLSWLHRLTEWQQDLRSSNASDSEFAEAIKDDLFQEQIFVLTPKGEVKDLPFGSTPLDFAYSVHSMVGDHCAGARVMSETDHKGGGLVSRMVSLDYELSNGEIVEIITNRSAHPTRDWLQFAHTAAARNKIRRYLKINERPINIQIGRERLERELKIAGPHTLELLTEDVEKWISDEYHCESFEDLLAAIGADDIRPRAVVVKLLVYWQQLEGKEPKEESSDTLTLPSTPVKSNTASLQVDGVSGLLTKLANCCCPLPGDDIVGFITRGKGVMVHRTDCHNIIRLRERDRERLIHVSWSGMNQQQYHAPIVITARDRTGLIRDVATIVSDVGANLMAINTRVTETHEAIITATLEIGDPNHLQKLFARLQKIKGVTQVVRDMCKKK